jgi:hypothetical protein
VTFLAKDKVRTNSPLLFLTCRIIATQLEINNKNNRDLLIGIYSTIIERGYFIYP